jgi:hypothetical protein
MTKWLPSLPAPTPPPALALPLVVVGFILLGEAFRRPLETLPVPFGSWPARLLLGLILIAGLLLRLLPLDEPNPFWNDDSAFGVVEPRTALDFPDARPLIFDYGSSQPFLPYLVALAYVFFPDAAPLHVQKAIWGLLDALAIGVAYLLGKELGGRRTGLVLAAAIALSKPVIANCVSASVPVTTPLALGLALLFTFRFLREPDAKHALQWGVATAFGAYCYHATRPLLWFMPLAVIAWRWAWPPVPGAPRRASFAIGVAAVWTYGAMRVGILPALPGVGHPASLAAASLLAAVLLITGLRSRKDGQRPLTLGLLAAGLLMAPMLLHPLFSGHQQVASVFNPANEFYPKEGLTPSFWRGHLGRSLGAFFGSFADREELGLPNEALWSLHSSPLVLAGLAWAIVRRERRVTFLLACAFVGFLPHFFSFGSHTGRLMGAVVSLLVMGAVSWGVLWSAAAGRGRIARLAAGFLLLLWGAWAFQAMTYRFQVAPYRNVTTVLRVLRTLREDLPRRRIYLAESEYVPSWALNPLLGDRGDILRFDRKTNEVPRHAGGPAPDVMVLLHGSDNAMRDRLVREFPKGRLQEVRGEGLAPGDMPFFYRFYLDGKDVPREPGRLFRAVDVPEGAWTRRYYAHRFGLGHGLVERAEWVADPLAPTPRARPNQAIVIRGTLRIAGAGRYRFGTRGWNFAVLDVGGRRALDHRPTDRGYGRDRGSLHLEAGDYPVVLRSVFRAGLTLPPVTMQGPDDAEPRPLGSRSRE